MRNLILVYTEGCPMWLARFWLLSFGAFVLTSCAHHDGTRDSDFACNQIMLVGRYLGRLSYDDVRPPQSLTQLLDRVQKKGIGESKKKHLDYWQNVYLLEHDANDERVTIRILSKGENGLF